MRTETLSERWIQGQQMDLEKDILSYVVSSDYYINQPSSQMTFSIWKALNKVINILRAI